MASLHAGAGGDGCFVADVKPLGQPLKGGDGGWIERARHARDVGYKLEKLVRRVGWRVDAGRLTIPGPLDVFAALVNGTGKYGLRPDVGTAMVATTATTTVATDSVATTAT
jgi:hypothetical protein